MRSNIHKRMLGFALRLSTVMFLCGVGLALTAVAQSGGPYVITQSVIAGGGQASSGGTFSLTGTIGQPAAGTYSAEDPYVAHGGFWHSEFLPTAAGVDVAGADKGPWYKEIGQGMGAALNTGSASNAYVLTDRGTWLAFKNRGDLEIVVEGDNKLFNQYGVILVNPEKHPSVKKAEGQAFIDWLVSAEGQKAIADYQIGGQQLFFPNANASGV